MIAAHLDLAPVVRVTNGQPTTTSLLIAEKFGKRHADVLRAVENLECSTDFRQCNFALTSTVVPMPNGGDREDPMYRISRDGFAFLAMGFTGKKAAQWKEKFLAAFNWQATEIARLRTLQSTPEWAAARLEGKAARRIETDTIKTFVEYAKSQGSKSAGQYYMAISKETNRSLFFVESAVGAGFRDGLTSAQLASVAMAERIVERALLEAMASKVFYRDAYRIAADRLRQFAGFVGKSVPGKAVALLEAA